MMAGEGKIRDGMMMYVNLLSLVVEYIAEIFTGKPNYVDYIKNKLRNRFNTKVITVDKDRDRVSFYLSVQKDLTLREKFNTAKVFGATLRNVRFVRLDDSRWKITFLPKGVQGVRALIQTFPNLGQQINTSKTLADFEPKEEIILTREQKLRLRKEQKQTSLIASDIFDYLMRVPIVGFCIRQVYWNRHIFRKFFSYMPKDSYDVRILPWYLAGLGAFILFIYTFVFWATILCILIAGYGIHKLRGVIKIK